MSTQSQKRESARQYLKLVKLDLLDVVLDIKEYFNDVEKTTYLDASTTDQLDLKLLDVSQSIDDFIDYLEKRISNLERLNVEQKEISS